ncbi:major facilitator transporter [Caballeronia udeis]|uniref:Major facilitator transporter n=1 Tax=Caballeronia udeis TaxID=1232866 RepID=A0A158IEC9_9BURK|nr:MFS transporter [Caballeronia udeis]SAL54753.1 major facilitator transporter [Caballeronia udeis]
MDESTNASVGKSDATEIFASRVVPAPSLSSQRIVLDSVYSWYVLGILTVSYSLAYIDRQLLNLLVDPIKHSLLISDTQISLIQGSAFIAAYLLASPFFGRLVDSTNRRNVLLFGVCAWSICTALCGKADTYSELFIARFGVGVSEACAFPVGCSLIADYFSARRAARALSILTLGPLLGGGFSLVAGGLVIAFADSVRQHVPEFANLVTWKLAFVLVGLPGFLLALVLLTVREPTRRVALKAIADDRKYTSREAAAYIWARRGFYMRIYFGIGMQAIVALGVPTWLPSFLIRYHHVPPALVGYHFGLLVVTCGSIGVVVGPWVSRLLERKGYDDAALRASAMSMCLMTVACAAIPVMPGPISALTAAACAIFFWSIPAANITVAMQLGTPNRMRGVVSSLFTFFAQLIGFGIGPTAIALITDRIFHDPKMVGASLGIVCSIASAVAVLLIFSALPQYRKLLDDERHVRPS